MTYQHPHDVDDSAKSIADLCAPVSATKMPTAAMRTRDGEVSGVRALGAQRLAPAVPQTFAKFRKWRASQ